jgi:SAM-dependent methyltransferase
MSNFKKVPYEFKPDYRYPAYLTRIGLYKAVSENAFHLSGKLMDLGCGSKPYQSLFNVDEYVGVDYASEGHPHDNEDIDVYYDGITLPFPNNHFDAVFSSEVFEHVFNLEQLLPEVNRVMKPGAKILVTCPFVICEHEVPNDYARYTSFALKHLFEKNGFSVLAYEKTGTYVTAIMQLRIMYIHQHVLPIFRKIPLVRSGLRLIVYTGMNIFALIKNKLLPKKTDLYLNNVILCEKI